jgi:hypothetical protein
MHLLLLIWLLPYFEDSDSEISEEVWKDWQ